MSHPADLRCPSCGAVQTCVKDSRGKKDRASIWRRRECLSCTMRFSTMEMVEPLTEDAAFRLVELATALLLKVRSRTAA